MDLERQASNLRRSPYRSLAFLAGYGVRKLQDAATSAPAAAVYAAHLAKKGIDMYNSRKRARKSPSTSRVLKAKTRTTPLTTQRDISVSRGGKDKSKSFRRFQKKVRLALQAEQPRQIYTKLFKQDLSTALATQSIGGTYWGDNNGSGSADLYEIFKSAFSVASTAACEQYKVHLGSMGIKLQILNEFAGDVYIDVYMCSARKAQPSASTPKAAWDAYFADMAAIGTVSSTDPAITPYANANWCRYWKIKKKWSVKLKALESFAIEQGRRVNRVIPGRQIQDQGISPGQIMFMYFARGAPNAAPAENNSAGISGNAIRVSVQKTFFFREVASAQQKDEIDMTDA